MPVKNHIHKYLRHIAKTGTKFYFCVDDVCTHRIPIKLSVGKLTECWICGEPFKLTPYSIQLAKPHCPDCTNKQGRGVRKDRIISSIKEDKMDRAIINSSPKFDDLRTRLVEISIPKNDEVKDSGDI